MWKQISVWDDVHQFLLGNLGFSHGTARQQISHTIITKTQAMPSADKNVPPRLCIYFVF